MRYRLESDLPQTSVITFHFLVRNRDLKQEPEWESKPSSKLSVEQEPIPGLGQSGFCPSSSILTSVSCPPSRQSYFDSLGSSEDWRSRKKSHIFVEPRVGSIENFLPELELRP